MKRILFILSLALGMSMAVSAQDDMEAIVSDDIEIEGLENFWIECSLDANREEGVRPARPAGGTVEFLTYVQKCMARVVSILFNKYPEEMLGMLGTHADIYVDFAVTEKGTVELEGITNGAMMGVDPVIANKMLKNYRRWRPAKKDGEPQRASLTLKIDVSI